MANTSILTAFERMWQHITAKLGDKASKTEAQEYAMDAANAVKNDLLNGAGGAYDTLKELGDLIDDNTNAIDALETVASGKADKVHEHTVSDITDLTATATELNHMSGATSNIQAQLDSLDNSIQLKSTDVILPLDETWYNICCGDGKFIIIPNSGSVALYSEDGINWSQITLPISKTWRGVAYGNGTFVIVSYDDNVVLYSSDGINWEQSTIPTSARWFSVAYGNGKFAAISYGDKVAAYSTDGVNWETSTLGATFAKSVTYGNNKFVAVANDSTTGAYSTDGITWTTMSTQCKLIDVAYGNGKFVGVSEESNQSAYSEDGINWTTASLPVTADWRTVAYGNGVFVAIAYDSNIAAYSKDGVNWVQTTLPITKYWQSVEFGNNRFIAISNSEYIVLSNDGINWSTSAQIVENLNGDDMRDAIKSALGVSDINHTHSEYYTKADQRWNLLYDSGEISDIANSISNIDVSGYTNIQVLVRIYNDGDSINSRAGSAIFTCENGKTYQFPVWSNMFSKSINTVYTMATFNLVDGWLVCPCASRLIGDANTFDEEGGTAGNLSLTGSGMMKCTSPLSTLTVSSLDQNSNYYFGMGSRVMVWGWN